MSPRWPLVGLLLPLAGCVVDDTVAWPDGGGDLVHYDSPCADAPVIAVPDECPMIQWAIDAASPGARIEVAPGPYYERIDFHGKEVHVWGVGGSAETVLDGLDNGTVVTFAAAEGPEAVLQGFTVRGGGDDLGGGLLLDGASPTLIDLVVRENEATGGGGLYLRDSQALLMAMTVAGNRASSGGGLYLEGSAPTLLDVTVEENDGLTGHGGGMRSSNGSRPTMHRVAFLGNRAHQGGGLTVDDAACVIRGARFEGQLADSGSGIELVRARGDLAHVLFADEGVAILATMSTLRATNLVVIGDVEGDDQVPSLALDNSTAAITNAVIASSGTIGVQAEDSEVELTNVVIAGHEYCGVRSLGDGSIRLRHSDVWDNAVAFLGMDDPTGSDGNLAVDPQWLATPTAEDVGALHLGPDSPLIDAGDPALKDPDGSPADIGAFGGPGAGLFDLDRDGFPAWWQPGQYDPVTYPEQGWDCDDLSDALFPYHGC